MDENNFLMEEAFYLEPTNRTNSKVLSRQRYTFLSDIFVTVVGIWISSGKKSIREADGGNWTIGGAPVEASSGESTLSF